MGWVGIFPCGVLVLGRGRAAVATVNGRVAARVCSGAAEAASVLVGAARVGLTSGSLAV